jgi:DNA polymerase-3 subunit gamma/tau
MATQSLYRRYRPRRFSELKGQDHVVKALRDAVMQGREGQAYLFSGPRGTGKTTSARILAKVLNCENVVDGEPCCECESCLAVERGTSYDVHELDAASNNGVDAIRDLVEKASLGTPGRHKVYILDEVHMLSKAAEAALLKTLEEPPPHVVFVLATTDPQKMSDTIRSRTQHLQFHLLPSDTLAEHVKWVAADAGLDLPQAALDAAIVQGGGSARDTLSALELLANTGGDTSDVVDLDEFLVAIAERDAGRALTAMGHAVNLGRDPRTLTEQIVRHLRNAFLSIMAPELVVLPPDQVDAIAQRAQQLGAATLVRAIEQLGSTLVEMRHAPDPRILVEVALVQLTHDEVGNDVDALLARIERLEQTVKQLRESGVAATGAAASAAAPRDPATGRAVLGGAARRDATGATPRPAAATAPERAPAAAAEPVVPEAPAPATAARAPAPASIPAAWDSVKSTLRGMARARFATVPFIREADGVLVFGVPNEATRTKCAEYQRDVEAALAAALGSPVTIDFTIASDDESERPAPDDTPRSAPAARAPAAPSAAPAQRPVERAVAAAAAMPDDEPVVSAPPPPDDDEIDLSELTDAPPESVKTPLDRLAEAFPGSELINDD